MVCTLSQHKSTVNDICFSKDGYLLTVSKDRTCALFDKNFVLQFN
jgi:WD40 repeat protein